jgi:leader peptidase (prepilin peptidase)/N-methyltransferase
MVNALPHWLAAAAVAPFVGSFLGLVATRHGDGRGIVAGHSRCDRCGEVLALRDLVPLLSWVALRGRCRQCGARIDAMLPLIELGALVATLVNAAVLPGAWVWVGSVLAWSLIAIAAIDWRHLEIPDRFSLPLVLAGLAVAAVDGPDRLFDAAIGASVGFTAFAIIAWVYRRLRGRAGLGDGDSRLMAAAGAWVGWQGLAAVTLYGAGAGLVWALARGAWRGHLETASPMAFGPFLGLGIWIVWLFGPVFEPPGWAHP